MNSDILFYCWQLELKTFSELQDFKTRHNASTTGELIRELSKEYNKGE